MYCQTPEPSGMGCCLSRGELGSSAVCQACAMECSEPSPVLEEPAMLEAVLHRCEAAEARGN